MFKHFSATTALLLALGAPALAQEQPPPADAGQAGAPQGEIAPDPEAATGGTTGGTTATGREILPDDTTDAPVDPQMLDAAAAASPGAGSPNAVSPEMVQALHQMALEQEKKSAAPPPVKSEAAKQAEQKAIAAHREGLFARWEEEARD